MQQAPFRSWQSSQTDRETYRRLHFILWNFRQKLKCAGITLTINYIIIIHWVVTFCQTEPSINIRSCNALVGLQLMQLHSNIILRAVWSIMTAKARYSVYYGTLLLTVLIELPYHFDGLGLPQWCNFRVGVGVIRPQLVPPPYAVRRNGITRVGQHPTPSATSIEVECVYH